MRDGESLAAGQKNRQNGGVWSEEQDWMVRRDNTFAWMFSLILQRSKCHERNISLVMEHSFAFVWLGCDD